MPISGNGVSRESYQSAAARAADEPLMFNPTERSQYVRSMVTQVLQMRRVGKTKEEIKALFPEFTEKYTNLFDMITAPEGFDQKNLEIMLALLDRMGAGAVSQHEASVIVGKRLFEKYGSSFR